MSDNVNNKKKQQKPEDFIGWKSEDGNLEVIGIAGKQGTNTTFKVICIECSKDKELFPDGYFISTKQQLKNGVKPCGCSKKPKWKGWQFLILARRAGEKKNFVVHGFAEEFKNRKTKLHLECLKDGYKWTASIDSVINSNRGCPKCKGVNIAEQKKMPEHIALQKCTDICKEMNYDAIGFPDRYKNRYSRFEYICKIHGKQNVGYHSFVNNGRRCGGCWKEKQKELGNGNGYYVERKDEQDYLYVLNFNHKFIKIGRSFDVDERIKNLRYVSKIKRIHKLRIYIATHQEIYYYEQELLNKLRPDFQYYCNWSTETLINDVITPLNNFLNDCNFDELKLEEI